MFGFVDGFPTMSSDGSLVMPRPLHERVDELLGLVKELTAVCVEQERRIEALEKHIAEVIHHGI